MIGFYLAFDVRFDFFVPPEFQVQRLSMLIPVILLKLVALWLAGQFGSMVTYFSLPDLFKLGWAMTGSSGVLLLLRFFTFRDFALPRGVILIDFFLCTAGFCALRLGSRLYRERVQLARKLHGRSMERIVIIGAGDAGASLAGDLLNSPSRGLKPVAFFDDDKGKFGQHVHGVPVVGAPESLSTTKLCEGVRRAVIAMPSAHHKRIREVALLLAKQGYKVETIPSIDELASGRVKASRIRPVDVVDLLGREEIHLDTQAIRHFIEGKVVMVTGAGGSIGSELCRQIAAYNPMKLLMLDQSEAALFLIEQEMKGLGTGALAVAMVGDILDEQRMNYLFGLQHPQIVFHAAAYKHVHMMERHPKEAVRNNSTGTRLLAGIAERNGADAFVLISTDKAINPTNVMGASKRLAEIHLEALQARANAREVAKKAGKSDPAFPVPHTKFMAVRFGNVLGSSGSVVPIFRRQIEKGGPVTVTHPEVTRFFMTIPEAVQLVMQASVLGKGGEIFVLDMGKPVKILDLAHQMIELSGLKVGEDIEIEFIGLKPGEKLYEELQHQDEQHLATEHPRIMRFVPKGSFVESSRHAIQDLECKLYECDNNEIKRRLKSIIPEYTPYWE
jgi:FlaA1/EpsC-like NDP-sugar epimerase